jgi:hypothetical protein
VPLNSNGCSRSGGVAGLALTATSAQLNLLGDAGLMLQLS